MTVQLTYDSKTIDVKLDNSSLETSYIQKRNQPRTPQNVTHVSEYDIFEYVWSIIFSESIYSDMIAFWSYVRTGNSFALAMDTTQVSNTTLDASAAAGQKVIPLTDTTSITAGDECLIRAKKHSYDIERVEIASVSAGVSVTVEDNLIYSYQSSDIFRHWEYLPSNILMDTSFNPRQEGSSYFLTLKFAEQKKAIQGYDLDNLIDVDGFDFVDVDGNEILVHGD